jgi:hypothetical protein
VESEELKHLESIVAHAENQLAIEQLQSRYQHWLSLDRMDKVRSLFAMNAPGVSAEEGDSGVFVGLEGIARLYPDKDTPELGVYYEQRATNPIIEVASDGQRARGVWFSPGILTEGTKDIQGWIYGKYDNDYIKEDGEWRILHLRWRETFTTSFEKGWLWETHIAGVGKCRPPYWPADEPTTYHMPFDRSRVNYMLPEPPELGSLDSSQSSEAMLESAVEGAPR